jgi:hypothetical protein
MKKSTLTAIFVLTYLLTTGVAFADLTDSAKNIISPEKQTYTLLEPLPCIEGTGNNCKTGELVTKININQYINYVFKFMIGLAVFLSIVVIIYGGFEYMISEIPNVKVGAKGRIWNAVLGLIAVLTSYLILQTIDPRLVQVNTTIPEIKLKDAQKDVGDFQSKLVGQLKLLSAQRRNEVFEQEEQIKILNSQITEVESKIAKGEGDKAQLEAQLYGLKHQLGTVKSAQAQTIANGSAEAYFKNALSGYHKAGAFNGKGEIVKTSDAVGADAEQNAINQKNSIISLYKTYLSDPALANDPAAKERLDFQAKYYTREIDEERDFMSTYTKLEKNPKTILQSIPNVSGGPPITKTIPNPAYNSASAEAATALAKYKAQYEYITAQEGTVSPELANNPTFKDLNLVKKDEALLEHKKTSLKDKIQALETQLQKNP